MKKDYIPVSNTNVTSTESKFVENYWTAIWDKARLSRALQSKISQKEEVKIINPYISRLPQNAQILDGGCGLGEWTLYYSNLGYKTTGIDISKKTIGRLKKTFPKQRFVTGDIRNTKFKSNQFDAYFSWGTFEHFETGLGPCLKEANRILKPGGYLFITVPFQNIRHILRDAKKLSSWDDCFDKQKGYKQKMRFYQWRLTKPELEREFELHGFKTIQIRAIHKPHGLYRLIRHDLKIDSSSRLHRIALALLYPLIPRNFVAHMLIGVGQLPGLPQHHEKPGRKPL